MAKKENEKNAPACQGCEMWEKNGAKCWFFWEHKRECSQYKGDSQNVDDKFWEIQF